jgi:hypothetical protein
MWFFNQPGAGLAPTLRVLLSSSPWCLPLIDPAELGRAAATEAMPPRELLRQWGAGPSAPEHMAAAIEHYAKLLCARVTSDHGAGLLSESAVDAQLYAALCGESMAAPRWTTEPGQLTPAERGAVDAMMKAVPPAMWGMLLKTRGLLLDWQQTRAEEIGPKGVAAIDRLHGFTASDQLLRSAEVIAGREYTFVQAVWDRQRNKEQISSGDRDTANILKRVGFFMNYASSIRACALVGDRDGAGQGRPGHPPVIRPSSIGSGRVGDRIVLRFKNHELLVKLSGRDQPGDPIIRCFQPRAPASASTGLAIDLQLWAKRVQRIADDQTPEGELPNRGWTMAGQAWQPDLMRGLAREGLLPDAGLGLVRGTPSWHQSRSMELIEQLRRGA